MDQFALDFILQQELRLLGQSNRHFLAAGACHQALVRSGIPCDFVTEDQLSGGVPKHYRVLILPHVRIVGAKVAEALAAFVRRGGALWADGRCGFADRHLFLRRVVPGNGLDAVFGAREADQVAPFADDLLLLADGSTLPVLNEVQRLRAADSATVLATCGGYPAAVRNRFGDGVAELWGTDLAANPEADISALLTRFVAEQGVVPPFKTDSDGEAVASFASGKGVSLAVFTSLAEVPTTVMAKLPDRCMEIINDVPAVPDGDRLTLELAPGETAAVLIRTAR